MKIAGMEYFTGVYNRRMEAKQGAYLKNRPIKRWKRFWKKVKR